MTERLSLGEERACARCKNVIPPDEIGAVCLYEWLCTGCWNLWKILEDQTIADVFAAFLRSGKKKGEEKSA